MASGLRICYANTVPGLKVQILGNSKYKVKANTPSKVIDIKNILSYMPNVTQFDIVTNLDNCIGRMLDNETDVTAGNLPFPGSGVMYQVPVPWSAQTLYIVSGYNETQYQLEQAARGRSLFGVLANLSNFESPVYLVMILLLLSFVLVSTLNALILILKTQIFNLLCSRRKRKISYKKTLVRRLGEDKWLVFLLSISSFLIFTPFRCMYKTTQIIAEQPPLIKSYQEILDKNISVMYKDLYAHTPSLCRPSGDSVRKKDLIYQFYRHLLTRKFKEPRPKSKKQAIDILAKRRLLIFNQQLVFIGDDEMTERSLAVSCSLTYNYEIHRYSKYRDELQREDLAGFAVRLNVKHGKLMRNLRRVFEGDWVTVRETRLARYTYKDFQYLEPPESHEQYRKQRSACFEDRADFDETQDIFMSDVLFFSSSFVLCMYLFGFATIILIVEKKLHSKLKSKKKSRVGHQAPRPTIY